MPRIYDGFNDPHDFCRECYPTEDLAIMRYGAGTGPNDRGNCYGYDAEHPPYEGEDYRCDACGKLLNEEDN